MKIPTDSSLDNQKAVESERPGQGFVKHIIGDGQNTSIWLDNWHHMGSPYKTYGEAVVLNLGRSLTHKVSTIISNGIQNWPRLRNRNIQQIKAGTPSTFLPRLDKEDEVVWTLSSNGQFSTKSTWEALKVGDGKVLWAAVIWFCKNVPKWAFISWLACRGKLATKDGLRRWEMAIDTECVLCSQKEPEVYPSPYSSLR